MKRFVPLALVLYGCSSAPGDGPMIHQAPLAAGVRISKVVAYQGLQATIMKDGQPTASEVPLVIGRPAFVRTSTTPLRSSTLVTCWRLGSNSSSSTRSPHPSSKASRAESPWRPGSSWSFGNTAGSGGIP